MVKLRILFVLAILGGLFFIWKKDTSKSFDIEEHLQQYIQLKVRIARHRDSLHHAYLPAPMVQKLDVIKHSQAFLQTTLSQRIFPYWYDTPWSYSGTTSSPRQGKIACGYFVTTTLQHAGFKLNRYRLAQQAASVIIRRLCQRKSIKTIGNNNTPKLIAYLKKQPDGIYILGLDTHVGFIEKYQGKLAFIHSSFSTQRRVVREPVATSKVIGSSSIYVVGNLLANQKLVTNWLLKKKV